MFPKYNKLYKLNVALLFFIDFDLIFRFSGYKQRIAYILKTFPELANYSNVRGYTLLMKLIGSYYDGFDLLLFIADLTDNIEASVNEKNAFDMAYSHNYPDIIVDFIDHKMASKIVLEIKNKIGEFQ